MLQKMSLLNKSCYFFEVSVFIKQGKKASQFPLKYKAAQPFKH